MDKKLHILVTGGSGQLGQCLKELVENRTDSRLQFEFLSSSELDITKSQVVSAYFENGNYDYCINCAAYTQVDRAETDVEQTKKVNIEGVKNIAKACTKFGATLIHISTDFIFDGDAKLPYKEASIPNPLGVYGQTKLNGEIAIKNHLKNHFILRTSWLYSEYGNNFMKTMLRLGNERASLSVIDDQKGTPTYSKDLAETILNIIVCESTSFGTYHFSNEGETSWYGFAKKIFELSEMDIDLSAIPTEAYPTPARRPKYSVLDKSKIKKVFKMEIPHWEESLELALKANKSIAV